MTPPNLSGVRKKRGCFRRRGKENHKDPLLAVVQEKGSIAAWGEPWISSFLRKKSISPEGKKRRPRHFRVVGGKKDVTLQASKWGKKSVARLPSVSEWDKGGGGREKKQISPYDDRPIGKREGKIW